MVLKRAALRVYSVRRYSYITTPIFYANAAPHIGHLYTTVLADAAHRWERLKDLTGPHIFSTGTDEHGIKIYRAAEAAAKPPQQYCDDVSGRFRHLFGQFTIQHTDFIRTTEPHHKEAVQYIWKILKDKNLIYKDIYRGWYSVVDECFYHDKDVENVQIGAETVKVVKGTKTIVDWVEEENYMFRLSKFRDDIKNWLSLNDVIRPKHYLPIVWKFLEADEDLSISRCRRRLPWGIAVPDDAEQTIYVWLDALVNYLSVCGFPHDTRRMETNWPPTCQIIGKDIIKFHAVYWPAFLLGAGLPLPKRLFVHGHWLVDNAKMSKSLGNVVDPFEAAEQFTTEGLRYFLLKQGVPQDDSSFTPTKALQVINSDLVNNFGNLLSRSTVSKLNPRQKYTKMERGALSDTGKITAEQLVKSLDEIGRQTAEQYDQILFYKAIEGLMTVLKQANGFFQAQEPWKMDSTKQLSSVLHICYETLRVTAILLQPVVPKFSSHVLDRLGIPRERRGIEKAKYDDSESVCRPLGQEEGSFIQRLKAGRS